MSLFFLIRQKFVKVRALFLGALCFAIIWHLTIFAWVPSASVEAAQLKAILKRGHLIVAVKDNVRPLGFRDETGTLQGLEIDLAHRLAAEILGDPEAVELVPVSNQDRLKVVLDGTVDLTIARVTATETRGRLVDFSYPYYLDGTGFVTKDPNVSRLADIGKQPVALLDYSDTVPNVQYFLPKAKLVAVDSYQAGKLAIEAGKAGAFAADASILAGWVQEYPEYRIVPILLSADPLSVVMPRGLQYTDLRNRVNNVIQGASAQGWLKERWQYWQMPVTDK
jgi:polar amino acid transport system substrate-binding protein